MSNLATITNNILADSGIDDINVIVSTGSYANPAWITSLAWTKITGAPLGDYLPLAGGVMTGQIVLKEGTNSTDFSKGLRFPNDPYGGSGDTSGLRLYAETTTGAEAQVLELYVTNDGPGTPVDRINFAAPTNDLVTINGNRIWNSGNLPSPVTGTGASGTIPIFTGSTSIGNSIITASASLMTVTSNTDGQIIQMARSGGAYAWKLGIDSSSFFNIYNNSNTSYLRIHPDTGWITINGPYGTGSGLTISGTTYSTIATNRGASTASAGMNYFSVGAQRWFAGIYENSDNFGFYSVATNNFPLIITTGGSIGVNTLNPNVRLHVEDGKILARTGDSSWGQFAVANPNDAETTITWGAGGTGYPGITSTYTRQWIAGIGPFSTGTDRWSLTNKTLGANTAITVLEGGNVGIGTISPNGKLSVEATGNHITLRAPGATAGKYWALDITTENRFYLINNTGTQYLTITDAGAATFSSRVGVAGAAATYPITVYNASNGTTAAFGGTARGIRIDNDGTFSSGRSTIFGVDSSFYGSYQPLSIEASSLVLQAVTGGNVLIGTTSDNGQKLRVNGNVEVTSGNSFRASYNNSGSYDSALSWATLQLGNNGSNRIIGGRTAAGGFLQFYVNTTNDCTNYSTVPNGTLALTLASTGAANFSNTVDVGTDLTLNNGTLFVSAGSGQAYSGRFSTAYIFPYITTYLDSYAGPSWEGRLIFRTNSSNGALSDKLTILNSGAVTISGLAGSGNRIVVANSGGTLISAVIGSGLAFDGTTLTATGGSSGSISGSGTSGTVALFTGTSSIGNSVITQSSGNIGISISSPQAKSHVANLTLDNSAYQHIEYLTANNSTEASGESYSGQASYGIGFRRQWTSSTFTNMAGIYAFGSGGWRGGLLFRTKNNTNSTGEPDVNALFLSPIGNVGIGTTSVGVRLVNSGGTLSTSPTLGSATIGSNAILSENGLYGLYTGVASAGHVWQQVQRNDGGTATYPLVLQPNGSNVLIGTTSDNGSTLRVNGSIFADGNIRSVTSIFAAAFFEVSDSTIKTLVQDNYQAKGIESVVAKLYIKNGKHELGYFAQDLESILPSAVNKGTDGLLNLSYREVHTAKIAALEKRITELESQLKNN
jgi:hypothetical protein